MRKVSTYDVAKKVGVSPSTVSRIFNGRGKISANVKKRVIKASRSMGFVPNKKSTTIGVIIGEMSHFDPVGYTGMLVVYLARHLKERGLAMQLIDESDLEYTKLIAYDVVIGIVFNETSLINLKEFDLPVITINYPMLQQGFHSICVNHFDQTYVATEHLFDNGHKKIAFLECRRKNWGSEERLSGFKFAHEKRGVVCDSKLIQYSTETSLHEIVETILRLKATAIINCTEEIALELPYYLQAILKKKIPEDVSLVTIEVNPVQKYMTPAQTVIHQPLEEMCMLTVEKIQKIISGDLKEILEIELNCDLIKRDSVRKIN